MENIRNSLASLSPVTLCTFGVYFNHTQGIGSLTLGFQNGFCADKKSCYTYDRAAQCDKKLVCLLSDPSDNKAGFQEESCGLYGSLRKKILQSDKKANLRRLTKTGNKIEKQEYLPAKLSRTSTTKQGTLKIEANKREN